MRVATVIQWKPAKREARVVSHTKLRLPRDWVLIRELQGLPGADWGQREGENPSVGIFWQATPVAIRAAKARHSLLIASGVLTLRDTPNSLL